MRKENFYSEFVSTDSTEELEMVIDNESSISNNKTIDPREISPQIDLLQFELFSRSNSIERFNASISNKYVFIFNLESSVRFYMDETKSSLLSKFNSLIYFGKAKNLSFELKENRKYHFTMICIEAAIVRRLMENCKTDNFLEFIKYPELSYIGGSNLKVIDYLRKIEETGQNALSELEIAGNIYIILHSSIKQYLQDKSEKDLVKSSLKNWEISELEKISAEIRQNPEYPYTVSKLSKKTGVSIPRLQEGFKEMHDMTVSLFIREARLEKAEQLIRKFDYSISEIVYSIGLNSRSYFSRIFKDRYKVSPSQYQRKFDLNLD